MKETTTEIRDEIEIDLRKLLLVYLNKLWLIIACGFLAAVISLAVTKFGITPMYQADIMVYVNNSRSGEQVDYISGSNLSASQQLVNTYVNIIRSDTVLTKVIEKGELTCRVEDVREMMTTSQVDKTEIFEVRITHENPEMAAHIANVIANVAPGEIEEFVEGSSTKIIDYAKVPDKRSSPSYTKNTLVGGILGCMLAVAYVTIRSLMDVRIKDEEDLMQLFTYPILGQIPSFDQVPGKRSGYGYGGYRSAYETQEPMTVDNEGRG